MQTVAATTCTERAGRPLRFWEVPTSAQQILLPSDKIAFCHWEQNKQMIKQTVDLEAKCVMSFPSRCQWALTHIVYTLYLGSLFVQPLITLCNAYFLLPPPSSFPLPCHLFLSPSIPSLPFLFQLDPLFATPFGHSQGHHEHESGRNSKWKKEREK